jgi:hypothetical protein
VPLEAGVCAGLSCAAARYAVPGLPLAVEMPLPSVAARGRAGRRAGVRLVDAANATDSAAALVLVAETELALLAHLMPLTR